MSINKEAWLRVADEAELKRLKRTDEDSYVLELIRRGVYLTEEFEPKKLGEFARKGLLQGGNLRRVGFYRIPLEGANFSGCLLDGAGFESCGMADVVFDGAQLDGAVIRTCSAYRASFRGVLAERLSIIQSLIGGADFTEAYLLNFKHLGSGYSSSDAIGCKFDGADLRGARFKGIDLRGCSFQGAKLDTAVAEHCIVGRSLAYPVPTGYERKMLKGDEIREQSELELSFDTE